MSTRCNIKIKQNWDSAPIWLYHHHDGYLEGVGADLNNRLAGYKCRWYAPDIANKLVKDSEDEYEITMGEHGDIDYLYEILCFARKMKVWEIRWLEKEEARVLVADFDYERINEEVNR